MFFTGKSKIKAKVIFVLALPKSVNLWLLVDEQKFSLTGMTQISALRNKNLTVLRFLNKKTTTFSSLTSSENKNI